MLACAAWRRGLAAIDRSRADGRRSTAAHAAAPSVGERRAAGAAVGAVEARDLVGRNDILDPVAPGEDDEGREGADEAERRPATRYARSARSP